MRFLGIVTSLFDSSSLYEISSFARNTRSSARVKSSKGLTIKSKRGYMLDKPRVPAPRITRSKKVSAWSSRVCPTATRSTPTSTATRRKKSNLAVLAAFSIDVCQVFARDRMSTRSTWIGCSNLDASFRQNSSSSSESRSRNWWFKWTKPTSLNVSGPDNRSSKWSKATESDPPETAAITRPPWGIKLWRRIVCPTRSRIDGMTSRLTSDSWFGLHSHRNGVS